VESLGKTGDEMLQHSAVVSYLLSLGLLEPSAVVDDDLVVIDSSRRNCVFIAEGARGAALVVKQARSGTASTLAHEAAMLRVLASETDLARHVPAVVHYDAATRRLVLRTPPRARDWSGHYSRGRFPSTPARALGRALASLHRLSTDDVETLPSNVDPMWVLSLPEPPSKLVLELSIGAEDLVARIQASRALCDRLHALRDTCAADSVVHHDLRWDNCLAVAPPGSDRRTRLLLVDWELAGPGVAAFDLGTVFAEYLRLWVGSIPIVVPSDPGRLISRARVPLLRLQPAMRSVWSAYRLARPRGPTLRRVVQFTAVRLLQTAMEQAQSLGRPSAHVVSLVQLADNMLKSPDDAALHLLALRE
jgi:Ser/Thr protein kinase RdoA (MazF antagonist)